MYDMPGVIGQDLHFDMARLDKIFFDQQTIIAKTGACLALGRFNGLLKGLGGFDHAHTLAAAAGACL